MFDLANNLASEIYVYVQEDIYFAWEHRSRAWKDEKQSPLSKL